MQIILHAGDARVKVMQALESLEKFDVAEAEKLLKEAEIEITEAHKYQTVELQREANGEDAEFTVLLTHAQDTCMAVCSEFNIAQHLVRMTKALDERFKSLEK